MISMVKNISKHHSHHSGFLLYCLCSCFNMHTRTHTHSIHMHNVYCRYRLNTFFTLHLIFIRFRPLYNLGMIARKPEETATGSLLQLIPDYTINNTYKCYNQKVKATGQFGQPILKFQIMAYGQTFDVPSTHLML